MTAAEAREPRVRDQPGARATHAFVVLNPRSGSCDRDTARGILDRHFGAANVACRVHEPTGDDALVDLVREAVRSGCDLVVAAGGDGTVSAVADAVAGTETPLGIIPLGTANVLARELGIPIDIEAACALIVGDHAVTAIDAMELGGKSYLTQVGAGLDALMIRDTATEHKKRFGRIAYLWTAAKQMVGFHSRRFELTVDGRVTRVRAAQVLVANSGILGQPPFRWGPDIRPDDGVLDVCVIRVPHLWDYARLAWTFMTGRHRHDPNIRYLAVKHDVTIATISPKPVPVQADGEIVGGTPVTVHVRPSALRVVVPV